MSSRQIQRVYLLLLVLQTLSESLIWGINTLFLLDAGMTNAEAFGANAFFTAGMVLFEVPTGIVADTRGRRLSYIVGALTLAVSTLLYLLMWHLSAPFWAWAVASALLGLGFTFFSGAFEAWLVDALTFTGYFEEGGTLEAVLAKGEIVEGAAMLCGSIGGGALAQATNLGAPYALRAILLALTFGVALIWMQDIGFTPHRGKKAIEEIQIVLRGAITYGLANPPVRWIMLEAPFTGGVTLYAFYAMQPYLLQLYGHERAYLIAGLAAALVAGSQIAGGLLVPHLRRLFRRRTSVLLYATALSALVLTAIGSIPNIWIVLVLLMVWGLVFAAATPVRQAYLNGLIDSAHRATVLSFDAMIGSGGAAIVQPLLGRVADAYGYSVSYVAGAAIQSLSIPFIWLARREHSASDSLTIDPKSD